MVRRFRPAPFALTAAMIAAVAGSAAVAIPGRAATTGTSATATILAPIAIVEIKKLNFGGILPPASGSQLFTVSTAGVITASAGTGQAVGGGHHAGEYSITGTTGEAFVLTLSSNGCTSAFLNLDSIQHNIGVPFTFPKPNFNIGGVLQVAAGVAPGPYTCIYGIEAKYP